MPKAIAASWPFTALVAAAISMSGPYIALAAAPDPYETGLARIHFGDLPEEAASAKSEGKILVIYFWQEGCPYCEKLEKSVMAGESVRKIFEASYYLLEVNIFGAKEIVDFGGDVIDEKEFAKRRAIQFTPTLVFFGHDGRELFRTVGVWKESHFNAALIFVRDGHYDKTSFGEFARSVWPTMEAGADPDPYSTGIVSRRSSDLGKELEKALGDGKLLLVYFWKKGNPYCELFEKEILSREKLRESIARGYTLIEVDALGGEEVTWVDGGKSSARALSARLGIEDVPALVFAGEGGAELFRMPGVWDKTTHLEAATYYVREGHYKKSSFQEYIRYVWFKPKDHQGEKE